MKWGSRYGADCVNSLFLAASQFSPGFFRFFCFTDNPEGLHPGIERMPLPDIDLPPSQRWRCWRKISLFSPDFPVKGPCLYLDIDTCILQPLAPLVEGWSGKPRFIKTWAGPKTTSRAQFDRINSSVMLYDPSESTAVWDEFHARRDEMLAKYPSDQGFVYDTLSKDAEFFTPGLCVSFKKHCVARFPFNFILTPKAPPEAIVVCFHGKPDPAEAGQGYNEGKWKNRCRPTPWVYFKSSSNIQPGHGVTPR